jgi:phage tail sheath gpL-like
LGRAHTLTEGATGKGGFSRGTSNTEMAANLAAAINAHPVLGGVYTATAAAGTVTIVGKIPGPLLHSVVITTNDATAFGLTQLAGGTWGAAGLGLQHIWTGRS